MSRLWDTHSVRRHFLGYVTRDMEFDLRFLLVAGAAIALIDSVFLPLHISGVTFKTIAYGMPRVCTISS